MGGLLPRQAQQTCSHEAPFEVWHAYTSHISHPAYSEGEEECRRARTLPAFHGLGPFSTPSLLDFPYKLTGKPSISRNHRHGPDSSPPPLPSCRQGHSDFPTPQLCRHEPPTMGKDKKEKDRKRNKKEKKERKEKRGSRDKEKRRGKDRERRKHRRRSGSPSGSSSSSSGSDAELGVQQQLEMGRAAARATREILAYKPELRRELREVGWAGWLVGRSL